MPTPRLVTCLEQTQLESWASVRGTTSESLFCGNSLQIWTLRKVAQPEPDPSTNV